MAVQGTEALCGGRGGQPRLWISAGVLSFDLAVEIALPLPVPSRLLACALWAWGGVAALLTSELLFGFFFPFLEG